jgi:hypothetical protein
MLFKASFCIMAFVEYIDDREFEELKMMDEYTSFFEVVDLPVELE